MVETSLSINIGILALQGASHLHRQVLENLSFKVNVTLVKTPDDLNGLHGIILPGGESTVMSKLLVSSGLSSPLKASIENGLGVFGTCAGIILLADHFGVLDIDVQRNAYGTQIDSFEDEIEILVTHSMCKAFFIRAPRITRIGTSVEEIARHGDEIVGVRQGNIMGITCHPEVGGTSDFHSFFVTEICQQVSSL